MDKHRMLIGTPRALAFGLGCLLVISASASAERFTDRKHGFSIEKPADWCVLSAKAITEDHRWIERANPELSQAVRDKSNLSNLIIAFTRSAGASPHGLTSTVKIGLVGLAPLQAQSGEGILNALLPSIQSLLPDVKVETAPELVTLAERSAGHMELTYTLKTEQGPERIAVETWVVPRGKSYLQIGATYPADDLTGDRAAVMELVSSLKFSS
jgi:hypothetical protein